MMPEKRTYTEPHTEVEVSFLPACDICATLTEDLLIPATVDGKTTNGQWANMCDPHFAQYGVGLGLGKGQRLILKPREGTNQ